jgi:hypothetical protein
VSRKRQTGKQVGQAAAGTTIDGAAADHVMNGKTAS